jgi:hypothetical protein
LVLSLENVSLYILIKKLIEGASENIEVGALFYLILMDV